MSEDHEHYAREIYVNAEDGAGGWGYLPQVLERLHTELMQAVHRISNLEDRVAALEKQTPSAIQAQHEADTAMADLRASGWSEEEDYR